MNVTVVVVEKSGDKNAEAKKSLAPSTHLGTQKGNDFQWRWNEHDKWKAEQSQCNTTARV